jgi:HEAT repeat protein
MQDPNVDTLTAATLALVAIGTDEALETVIDLLEISGDKDIRRAIAESLAANREVGYMTLFEALNSDDMMLRRSAVFGLGRIGTDWALIALNETFIEDEEWYVRSAAQVVFQQVYEDSLRGVKRYPDVPNLPWLKQWEQEMKNEGFLPYDTEIEQVFEEAITQTEDPLIRMMAAITVGQIGHYPMIDKIYDALKDEQEAIRDTAYRTLGDLQLQLGRPLPAPIG